MSKLLDKTIQGMKKKEATTERKSKLSDVNKKEALNVIKNTTSTLEGIENRTFSGDLRDIIASLKAAFSKLLHD
jgi:hypothetical protein